MFRTVFALTLAMATPFAIGMWLTRLLADFH
jgi:hypothetical protein